MTSRILMCPPDHFRVNYSINPWMANKIGTVDPRRARKQWDAFYRALESQTEVQLLRPQSHVPDLVFTANAGAIYGRQVMLSRFHHRERRPEEPCFREWFVDHGYEIIEPGDSVHFEGAGDALFQPGRNLLWAGYGFRTDKEAHDSLAREWDVPVQSLHLVDARFYHLDTCFCPLPEDCAMYYPSAFDGESVKRIEEHIKPENRIVVSAADAMNFACNSVLIGQTIYINAASDQLKTQLEGKGFTVHVQPVTEFMKAGGANKCLTISLDESAPFPRRNNHRLLQ
ncbi:hypothetical protein UR09_02040 [Candidatus Nitromaritima sp. SCGC AAA799-A02]|nr:hypothetical protein UZ36_04565 [Candidatus Nitromaritima sp. SCGC AAA799-C22]KMP11982.1 hypothetical protein UR09_02040 [Candidatus Nitromaritima sp. SCGC AAA799-A02]